MKPEKDTGPDGMPTKVIKTTSRIVVSHLTNVINQDIIELNSFPEFAIVASVRLLYRKKRFLTRQTFVGLQDVLKTFSTHLQRNNLSSSRTS